MSCLSGRWVDGFPRGVIGWLVLWCRVVVICDGASTVGPGFRAGQGTGVEMEGLRRGNAIGAFCELS